MKFLVIPGAPLLVVALTLHDADSPAAIAAYLVALGILIFGSVFAILYALYRVIHRSTEKPFFTGMDMGNGNSISISHAYRRDADGSITYLGSCPVHADEYRKNSSPEN